MQPVLSNKWAGIVMKFNRIRLFSTRTYKTTRVLMQTTYQLADSRVGGV